MLGWGTHENSSHSEGFGTHEGTAPAADTGTLCPVHQLLTEPLSSEVLVPRLRLSVYLAGTPGQAPGTGWAQIQPLSLCCVFCRGH